MSDQDTFHTEEHDDITGLVLSGGGARAAYQVGVLHQLAKWFEQENKREFDFPFKFCAALQLVRSMQRRWPARGAIFISPPIACSRSGKISALIKYFAQIP